MPKGTGLKEELRRAWPRTSSTHASLSGLIDTRLDRGLGPARPKGVERALPAAMVVAGECTDGPCWASLAIDLAPAELLEETESRRADTEDLGEYDAFVGSPKLAARVSVASDTLDARRVLRTASEEEGRLLRTDRGRSGGLRPLFAVGVSMLVPGDE